MRLPRVRFTVRRMMIAIATLAVVLAGFLEAIRLKRQRDVILEMPAKHSQAEQFNLAIERFARAVVLSKMKVHSVEEIMGIHAETATYYATLKRKYLGPANRPWWPVKPDPLPTDPVGRGRYLRERGEYRGLSNLFVHIPDRMDYELYKCATR
jgi:hypothetical protein